MITDRMNNTRYEKNLKNYKRLAIGALILLVFQVLMAPVTFRDGFKLADTLTNLLPFTLLIHYYFTAKKWGGQYMQWTEDYFAFKSRKYPETQLPLSGIISIDIKLDTITIETKQQRFEINIEDYTEYEDRLRMKENFRILAEKLEHSS